MASDRICGAVLHTLFPSSDYAIRQECARIASDLHTMYSELKEVKGVFRELKFGLDKLNDRRVAMDPNGLTRQEAIKSTRAKMMSSRNKIKNLERQVQFYEKAQFTLENNRISTDADARISELAKRMNRVNATDATRTVDNLDVIAESTEALEVNNNIVNDAMVSAWNCDVDVDEAMLDEYLKSDEFDDEFDAIEEGEVGEEDDEDEYVAPNPPVVMSRNLVADVF